MKILLAGGNGFIGSNVISAFSNAATITTLDTGQGTGEKKTIVVDLTEPDLVNQFALHCDKYDILIFLVGLAHKKGRGKDYLAFEAVNYLTLVNLTKALEKYSKLPPKIIFASTISVYGERYSQSTYDEESVVSPFSPYALTKLEAEEYLLETYPDLSWVLRFAPVYSSTFTLNLDRRSKIGRYFYRVGDGQNRLSLCSLSNIMTSIDGILKELVPPGLYNVSDQQNYTYNDILKQQRAKYVVWIPKVLVKVIFLVGVFSKNIFLKENSTKLITDNVFPSDQISKYVNLSKTINDLN